MISPRHALLACLAVPVLANLLVVPSAGARKSAQQSDSKPAQQTAAALVLTYADNAGGLKQLATDILKAQEKSDSARAQQLLDSFVLPHSRAWYSENFTEPMVAKVVPSYEASASKLPARLAGAFLILQLLNHLFGGFGVWVRLGRRADR